MPDGYAELHAEEAAYAQWAELAALKEEDDERVLKEALIRESEAGLDKKARIIFATFFRSRKVNFWLAVSLDIWCHPGQGG